MPDALPPIGPYISPTPDMLAGTRRMIAAAGGDLSSHDQVHRSSEVRYQDDPAELRRQRTPGLSGGSTCGCGRGGVRAAIPDPRTGERARVCIFCDAVHLMPKYAPNLEGDFS